MKKFVGDEDEADAITDALERAVDGDDVLQVEYEDDEGDRLSSESDEGGLPHAEDASDGG